METFFEDFKENIIEQYTTCPAYKFLCESQNFDPSLHLNSEKDIEKVPFLTTTLFKKSAKLFTNLLRVPLESIEKWTVSSSTSGDPSIVGRQICDIQYMEKVNELDKKTLKIESDQDCVFFPKPEVMRKFKSEVIYGKNTESYMGNILEMFHFKDNTVYVIKQEGDELVVDIEAFIGFLKSHDGFEHHLSIRGSTPLLYTAVKKLKEVMKPLNLGKNVLIQTGGGGWDGKKGTISIGTNITKQEFVEAVSSFLGVPEENFIDSYSFTENSFSITGHYSKQYKDYLFHITKWGRILIRDVKTLEPLTKPGEKGFIQMLNAYGTASYAGASILVDDIGEIVSVEECPDCKERVMTIRILGRVRGAEAKGCGATLNIKGDK